MITGIKCKSRLHTRLNKTMSHVKVALPKSCFYGKVILVVTKSQYETIVTTLEVTVKNTN